MSSITYKVLTEILPSYNIYRNTYASLKKSQWNNPEQIDDYQIYHLSKLLDQAYKNVPYYKKLFDGIGLNPQDIRELKDLQNVPFLTKEIIRDNLQDLKAVNYPDRSFQYIATGGSTGTPLGLYYERGISRAKEWAFIKTMWDRVGYRFRDKCVLLRGFVIESAEKGKFWEYSLFGRWLLLSSYHMTDDNLPHYVAMIREFKPRFIYGFPSSITMLAEFMKKNKIESFPTVRAALCGSENLYPWQRNLIEKVLRCRVYSWYGNTEQTVLAGECERSSYYHVFPEYGIVELVGPDGKQIKEEGKLGEVVSTSLINFIFPLIRYKTMDLATISKEKCNCGRNQLLLKRVEGRLQDFIVSKNGRLISLIITHADSQTRLYENIKEYQFYQDVPGKLVLNIVKNDIYSEKDTHHLYDVLSGDLGSGVDLKIRFVDNIPRTAAGKQLLMVQKLPISLADFNKFID
jgi:phenylacetate-CoA ligase